MQPKANKNQFTPKWRHFHPQATVWVQNPFDHDVVFQVADEHNVPFQYRMQAHKVAELPGGAIATLGVKAIVDELIQGNDKDVFLMWDANTRKKYEDQIILREKEAPIMQDIARGGEVDLTTSSGSDEPEELEPVDEEEVPFEDEPEAVAVPDEDEEAFADAQPIVEPADRVAPRQPNAIVADIAEASLAGKSNASIIDEK